MAYYGDRLVCVRYRYDGKRQKRLKTMELIVEEEEWIALKPAHKNEALVYIAVTLLETTLRQQVKQCGGRWNPERGLREIHYEQWWHWGYKTESLTPKVHKIYRKGHIHVYEV